MKTINIYGENKYEQSTKYREACRGIVLKEDKILLTYEVNTDQWFIPGGGLESGETIKECCARELAEETGHSIPRRPRLCLSCRLRSFLLRGLPDFRFRQIRYSGAKGQSKRRQPLSICISSCASA